MRPSFLGFSLAAIIATIATVIYLMNYKTMSTESNIQLLFLMSIAWSAHSLLHHYEEIYYDFNPLANKWTIRDKKL